MAIFAHRKLNIPRAIITGAKINIKNEMAKRKPIKLKVGVMPQIIAACYCSQMTVWRACHWNADTLKENEVREYIFTNKLNKRFYR
jgi:hypothetical protein